MNVRLGAYEFRRAAGVGVDRCVFAINKGRALEPGRRDMGFERAVVGAIGECALAVALNVCWRPIVGHPDTDVGDVAGVQVKSTMHPDGSLIVRPHDPPDFPYVLAVVNGRDVDLVGWLYGVAAKVDAYHRDIGPGVHRAGYWVPQPDLDPDVESLRPVMVGAA